MTAIDNFRVTKPLHNLFDRGTALLSPLVDKSRLALGCILIPHGLLLGWSCGHILTINILLN